ncbi:hypothetical protein [Curtobacterium pusillum]|uniref:hypothetical protein n=1 Tax=Curtobacterium pusillum TaxID=69373 RepID=UPI00119FEEBB|nr:hypothetical protein [Curtobacterium pusillum]
MFVAVPALTSLVPLLALPGVTASAGTAGWAAVAIGQSIGAAGAVVTELGWGLTGTVRVGRQAASAARQLLAWSFATKAIVLVVVAPAAAGAAALLAPAYHLEAAAIAGFGALSSVNAVWFFIGRGDPTALLLFDALPRTLCGVTAAVLLLGGSSLWIFVLGVGIPAMAAPVLAVRAVRLQRSHLTGMTWRRLLRVIVMQRTALAGRAVSAVYIALPVTLVAAVAPTSVVASFAGADRLQRMALTGLQAVPNTVQHWVGSSPGLRERLIRARNAALVSVVVGGGVGAVFVLVAPALSRMLLSEDTAVTPSAAMWCAGVITVVSGSRITGSVILVVLRRVRFIVISATVGASIGLVAIPLGAQLYGVSGALCGTLLAELGVLGVQVAAAVRGWAATSRVS